jgi:hypothetical protein
MLLDRGLTRELLEVALTVSASDPDPKTNRKRLTMALRDHVSDQEAEGKTKKCLTRVWLSPPAPAIEMISWARTAQVPPESRHLLHYGALLATFPFAGAVARVIGQRLRTEGQVGAADVRGEVRRMLGDSTSVDVAARKAYTTFRNLGMVTMSGQTITSAEDGLQAPPELAPWLAHALLLTRQADSLPTSSIRSAPELLGIELPGTLSRNYELLETHSHGGNPVVAIRHTEAGQTPSTDQLTLEM